MDRPLRVVVIGAGPAGLAVAIALRRIGAVVTVYERAPCGRYGGNGLTLWPNGLAALDMIGAGSAVRAQALAGSGMAIRTCAGRLLSQMSADAMEAVGGNGVAIHRISLLEALEELVDPATVRYGMRCVGVAAAQRPVARFSDGSQVTADVVVGADGIRSVVRSAAGLGGTLRYAGFTVWRATIPFVIPPCPGLLSMGGGDQFGLWRLPADRVYWFASTSAPERANLREHSRPPDTFQGWHAPIPDILAATPTHHMTVTDVYDSPPLKHWHKGGIVLVGDAAHPSLPNMGQGTSQAFEDAAVLADCLDGARTIDAALTAYQARRRRRSRAVWSQARRLARIGGWRSRPACWLRERMVSGVPQYAQRGQLRRLFLADV